MTPHITCASSVTDALVQGIEKMCILGKPSDSRNGPVLTMPGPTITSYLNPTKRVLLCPERDANPFFHFMEAMWMLAGRQDVVYVTNYAKQIAEYATDGETLNGAYGYRWRHWFDYDQLEVAIERLKKYPEDRRTVIQMWDGYKDLVTHNEEKDHPCNTAIYLQIIDGRLDMTVTCRSNDMLWGAYGANAVHFSFLQEYLASAIGVGVGIYYQFSNNLHVYTDFGPWQKLRDLRRTQCPYNNFGLIPRPLVNNVKYFIDEIEGFVNGDNAGFKNEFIQDVAVPMDKVHSIYKSGDKYGALAEAQNIYAADWRQAAMEWIQRRIKE